MIASSSILILVAFTVGAAFVQRTTGFGFGIFIMTVLPFIMPSYGESTALSGLLASVTSLILTIRYRKLIPWRRLIPILLTFVFVSFFAIQLLSMLRSQTLKTILGIALIGAAAYFWFFAGKIRVKPNLPTQASLGTLSGLMGGIFGMQGPPAVLYFLEVTKSKEEYTAIAQTYFLLGNAMMTMFRYDAGFVTTEVLRAWYYALPAVFVGTTLGGWAFNRISMPLLKKIVYAYIALSGVLALID